MCPILASRRLAKKMPGFAGRSNMIAITTDRGFSVGRNFQNPDALRRKETLHTFAVLMRRSRSAMKEQHLDARIIPESFCPNLEIPFGC